MGLIKITPENLAIIESASADTFVLPVDNDPVKLMSAIIMFLITVIEMDSRVFNLIKSDVALFLAAYKKIVGPEVVENMLKFISTYRNGGTEITLLGSSRMKGGVTQEQLNAAKEKAESIGATPEDKIFYKKTNEQFERERQVVAYQDNLQNIPQDKLALDLLRPNPNTVQTELNSAYDVFATAFAALQIEKDNLNKRESEAINNLEKIKHELNLNDSLLLKLHASDNERATFESEKKNIESLRKSIATVEEKIKNTSILEVYPLILAAYLSIGKIIAFVTYGSAALMVAGTGLAASSLMSASPTGIVTTIAVGAYESGARIIEDNPKPVMKLLKDTANTFSTFLKGFSALAQSDGDDYFDRTARITEDAAKNRENILTSGVLDKSGNPRVVESLISTGIRPNIGTTDGELYYNVNRNFLDGEEFGYVPFPEERTEGPLLEDNLDEPSQLVISLKKMIADPITRKVIIASAISALMLTVYIANQFYHQRKSELQTTNRDNNEILKQSINQVQIILQSAKTQRQQQIARLDKSLQDVRTEKAELMKSIGTLHREFTDAEKERLSKFEELFREYLKALQAQNNHAEIVATNVRIAQLNVVANFARGGLQQQANDGLRQLIGNENVNRIENVDRNEPQEELDQGGSLNRGRRLLSLPTRRAPHFSSSKKRRYTHRRRALLTGKVGYRPTKTGRKV